MDFPISVPSIGLVDGKFADEDPLAGTPGSLIPAQWGNGVTLEILNVIEAAGLQPNEFNNAQLLLAIRNIIQGAESRVLTDTGVAGAYTAANPIPLVAQPATGFIQRVRIASPNPGTATYSPDGIAARPIYGSGLQPLQGGELPTGVAVFMYLVQAGVNSGNGAWILLKSLGGSPQIAPATKSQHAVQLGQVSGIVGHGRNIKMSLTAASATATLTADEIIVETALGGLRYCLSGFNKTVNLASTGAGGMDIGSAPVNGFVSMYAIYNPSSNTSALLACAQSTSSGSIYSGANLPAGYTASALISAWATNGSGNFKAGYQRDRTVYFSSLTVASTTASTGSLVGISLTTAVPLNAISFSGSMGVTNGSAAAMGIIVAGDTLGTGAQNVNCTSAQVTSPYQCPIITPQAACWSTTSGGGTPSFSVNVTSYTF